MTKTSTATGISNIAALHLATFLERQPLQSLGTIETLRKLQSAVKVIRDCLGDYFEKYQALELKVIGLAAPYQAQVNATANLPQEEQESAKKKIQIDADKDEGLVLAYKNLNEYKRTNDQKLVELIVKNPEYFATMKEIFGSKALAYEQWPNREIILEIDTYLNA